MKYSLPEENTSPLPENGHREEYLSERDGGGNEEKRVQPTERRPRRSPFSGKKNTRCYPRLLENNNSYGSLKHNKNSTA